jgi:hypothetical protein
MVHMQLLILVVEMHLTLVLLVGLHFTLVLLVDSVSVLPLNFDLNNSEVYCSHMVCVLLL